MEHDSFPTPTVEKLGDTVINTYLYVHQSVSLGPAGTARKLYVTARSQVWFKHDYQIWKIQSL